MSDLGSVIAIWNNVEYKQGERVRVADLPHKVRFKPADTGHPAEIEAGPNNGGTIIGGEKPWLINEYHLSIAIEYGIEHPLQRDKNNPNVILVVRWDEQDWKEYHSSETVKLPSFIAEIHACYVEKSLDP